MYYAYGKGCLGWKAKRRLILAARLRELVFELPPDTLGGRPYIDERPGLVRIRRLTDYTPEQYREIVRAADQIYDQVMGLDVAGQGTERHIHLVKKDH